MGQLGAVTALLLAAGQGTRLRPLTDHWPKTLMPVNGRPLLEHWLGHMRGAGVDEVVVNVHHHVDEMLRFLERPIFRGWVHPSVEEEILGTAGAVRFNREKLSGESVIVVHADNLCRCDFGDFVDFHRRRRPVHTDITMMTFEAEVPEACGIVETDADEVVVGFHEKVLDPPGRRANGAVYVLDRTVLDWIVEHPEVTDFSTEVIPEYLGGIATWHNSGVHRDIGTPEMLDRAQRDAASPTIFEMAHDDEWSSWFSSHPIHAMVKALRFGEVER